MARIRITYQRMWIDLDLPDGTYTAEQLRAARLVVRQGDIAEYPLTWPGGGTEPPAAARKPMQTRRQRERSAS